MKNYGLPLQFKISGTGLLSPLKKGIIGAEGLNCSVRDGKKCFPFARSTGNPELKKSFCEVNCVNYNLKFSRHDAYLR